jgi:hypothetical protein
MELDFAVLADDVAPRDDGKLDIEGAGFDTIVAQATPALHARVTLALRFLVSRHEARRPHEVDVILQAADGAQIARGTTSLAGLSETQSQVIPPGRRAGIGMVLAFENVVFPTFGAYQVVIHWDGNEARTPLSLFVTESPASA